MKASLTLLVLIISAVAQAQNEGMELIPRVLTTSSVREVSIPLFSSWGYPFSDRDHNVYYRYDSGRFDKVSLLKISPSDSKAVMYELSPDDADVFLYGGAAVTPAGQLWVVCSKEEKGTYLFSFSSDAKPGTPTRLEVQDGLRPQSLIAVTSKAFLISGYYGRNAPKALQGKGFVGLFSDNGDLIKKFDGIRANTDLGADGVKPQVEGGAVGLDGNVYFLSAKGIIVFSSTGDIVKSIPLTDVPKGAAPRRLFESGGYLLVQFTAIGTNGVHINKYLLLDESTEKGIALYEPSPELGNAAVDFSRDTGLVFARRNQAGRLQFITAELK